MCLYWRSATDNSQILTPEWVFNVPLNGLDFNVRQKGKASNLKTYLILLFIKSILKSCYPCNLIGSQFIHNLFTNHTIFCQTKQPIT